MVISPNQSRGLLAIRLKSMNLHTWWFHRGGSPPYMDVQCPPKSHVRAETRATRLKVHEANTAGGRGSDPVDACALTRTAQTRRAYDACPNVSSQPRLSIATSHPWSREARGASGNRES